MMERFARNPGDTVPVVDAAGGLVGVVGPTDLERHPRADLAGRGSDVVFASAHLSGLSGS